MAAAPSTAPSTAEKPGTAQARLVYPATRMADVADDYFGTKVPDPYRWLEDDNSTETAAWVKAQNAVTDAFLASIPEREAIRARLTKLWDYERFGSPWKRGKHYFYLRNSGLQNQSVLYVTDAPEKEGRVLLDPNTLSADGTVALAGLSSSEDGRLLAYALAEAGSDWHAWRVREVATGKDRPDLVRWAKFGGASWKKDGSGFFYSRFDEPKPGEEKKGATQNQKVFFHALGTPQEQDVLIYARPDHPDWYLFAGVTDDGRWLVINAAQGTNPENAVFLLDLAKRGAKPEPLLDRMDASYEVVGNDGDTFYVKADLRAPRGRLVAIRRGATEPGTWREIIPEAQGKDVLQQVSLLGDRFFAVWMRDAKSAVEAFDLAGKRVAEIALPSIGTAAGFGGRRTDRETFFVHTGFTAPASIWRVRVKDLSVKPFRASKVDFDPEAYEARQVFFASKDGTQIPMFLLHKKGLVLDGRNPTILYGYGGFKSAITPSFNPTRIAWLEGGGVYALANLRGGGEYGQAWHDAGRLANKQNVFDDFVAAAEWLIAQRYTSPEKLAINGASNGGLLVGAVMTQRPELFAAAVPEVGVMDMLRFHLFTVGWGWKSDYGSSETKEGFQNLMRYSPLHSLKAGTRYPATLVMTADHDDRVVPAHSFKFTAALQAAQAGPAPVLARIQVRAGHGAGTPVQKTIEERTDMLAFLARVLGGR
ncbi:MAG: S9 family peptidase [Deltaproteobacteria bacterium]|nr:S9 family peptidase [Deltaproteobacteria bacterium]